jgi:hypothetical protein
VDNVLFLFHFKVVADKEDTIVTRLAVVETQLAWLVYLIGALINDRGIVISGLFSVSAEDSFEEDLSLAADVVGLIQVFYT